MPVLSRFCAFFSFLFFFFFFLSSFFFFFLLFFLFSFLSLLFFFFSSFHYTLRFPLDNLGPHLYGFSICSLFPSYLLSFPLCLTLAPLLQPVPLDPQAKLSTPALVFFGPLGLFDLAARLFRVFVRTTSCSLCSFLSWASRVGWEGLFPLNPI